MLSATDDMCGFAIADRCAVESRCVKLLTAATRLAQLSLRKPRRYLDLSAEKSP